MVVHQGRVNFSFQTLEYFLKAVTSQCLDWPYMIIWYAVPWDRVWLVPDWCWQGLLELLKLTINNGMVREEGCVNLDVFQFLNELRRDPYMVFNRLVVAGVLDRAIPFSRSNFLEFSKAILFPNGKLLKVTGGGVEIANNCPEPSGLDDKQCGLSKLGGGCLFSLWLPSCGHLWRSHKMCQF